MTSRPRREQDTARLGSAFYLKSRQQVLYVSKREHLRTELQIYQLIHIYFPPLFSGRGLRVSKYLDFHL